MSNFFVTFNNLLTLVSVYDSVETVKCPTTHQVPNTFFFNSEALYLVIDMEEERIIARWVVARSHKKASGAS